MQSISWQPDRTCRFARIFPKCRCKTSDDAPSARCRDFAEESHDRVSTIQGLRRACRAGLSRCGRDCAEGVCAHRGGGQIGRATDRVSGVVRAGLSRLGRGSGAHPQSRFLQAIRRGISRSSRAGSAGVVSIRARARHRRVDRHHRKLMPTFYEKLIWASGDGAGLRVLETPIGKVGMLICGENTNPLARYTLIAQGEQVHVSSYPPVWPTRPSDHPGRYDLAAATKIRAGAHSFEGKLFNIVASAFLDQSALDALHGVGREALEILEQAPRGVSMVIGPSGEVIGDVLCEAEGLLYQDIDISQCVEPKQFHDVVGYYNRFDIFDLKVTRKRLVPITFSDTVSVPEEADRAQAGEPDTVSRRVAVLP